MSIADLHKGFELIERYLDHADFQGEKPEELVARAESALGFKFSPTYRMFLLRYGCGDIAGQEFYGVIDEDFENSSVPDAIWLTLDERKASGLPEDKAIVYGTYDGLYYALDCSQRNAEGECPIVVWVPGVSKRGDVLQKIADDFGQFLRKTIEEAFA